MKMNDCTNCLNRGRCSVKGGPGQYCRGVAKGYVHGEWANGHGAGLVPDENKGRGRGMIRDGERFFIAMDEICDSADMIEDAVGTVESFGEMSDSTHDLILQKCIAIRALVRYAKDRHIGYVAPDEESGEERETNKEVAE